MSISKLQRDQLGTARADSCSAVPIPRSRNIETTQAPEVDLETRLIEETLEGNRAAFGRLVEIYQKRVFAVSYRYTRNEADAADVTQRAFIKAFESLAELKNSHRFASWLLRIATNIAKNQIRFRADKHFEPVEQTHLSSSPAVEEKLDRRADLAALRQAIERLPDKQRQTITLRIDAELTFKEIAEVMGSSEGSARVNYHHGLRALKQLMTLEPTASNPDQREVKV